MLEFRSLFCFSSGLSSILRPESNDDERWNDSSAAIMSDKGSNGESKVMLYPMASTVVKASNHDLIRVTVLVALALSKAVPGQ